MFKIGTFCTGIGSPEFAIEDIPHELVFGCEIDKFARASYLTRYKPKFMLDDMTKVDFSNPELYADIVMAGLPCQAFSIAGKRLGELDKRGVLIYNFYDYVKQQQPKAIILENVKGLKSINKGEIFKNWQRILGRSVNGKLIEDMHPDSLGYNLHWQVLNTKNFDLPQNRERIFIVGIRADLYDDYKFPENRELKIRLKDILEENVSEKYYLKDSTLTNFLDKIKDKPQTESLIRWQNKKDGIVVDELSSTLKTKGNGGIRYLPHVISPTLRASGGTDIRKRPYILIPEASKQGFAIAEEGDTINFSNPNSTTRRGRVGKQIANTIDTACNQAVLELVGNLYENNADAGRIYDSEGISRTLKSEGGGLGSKTGLYIEQLNPSTESGGKQPYKQNRIYNGDTISPALDTECGKPHYTDKHYRIRRLTPLECWRLQGYSDEYFYQAKEEAVINNALILVNSKRSFDIKKAVEGMSDTQLYKQAGNSISTTVAKAVILPVLTIIGTDVI